MRLKDISKGASELNERVLPDRELKQLQNVLLLMLDDIKKICDENHLFFILIGGTGIGAVRHQGFIPWDDDVDIAMPRSHYELLLNIIRNEYSDKYEISDARDKENYGKVIPKLRLKGTVYKTILDAENENPGVRLDIFLIENTYNNACLRFLHGVGCYVFGFALTCRRHFQGRKKYSKLSGSISFKLKAAVGMFFSFASLETWARWTDRWHSICKNDNSKYISIPSDGPHFFKGLTLRKNLCEVKEIDFEGRKMYIPKGYHNYLTGIYGDYMQVPPEEKRVRGKYLEFNLGKYSDLEQGDVEHD